MPPNMQTLRLPITIKYVDPTYQAGLTRRCWHQCIGALSDLMFVSVRCEQLQPTPTIACQLQLDGSV